jgi:2,3-bisphosphoglycerate-independent phosphoglycerate mutase
VVAAPASAAPAPAPARAGGRPAEVLVILDGATDFAEAALPLEAMPALRELAASGRTRWLSLLDDGVPVGSETAIASLLGWRPDGPVDRGLVEAAARGLHPRPDEHVWRVDVAGHRMLVFGDAPRLSARAPVRVWPTGARPPRILDDSTVVIGAPGAATGLGALMGARTVTPPGATGRPGSDLGAKRTAALAAIDAGAARVVVHVGGADEASHARNRAAKAAVLHEADRELIAPLAEAVAHTGGAIQVGPDHGCDPGTGEHIGGAVPHITWRAR